MKILVCICALLLSGCVGGSLLSKATRDHQAFHLSKTKGWVIPHSAACSEPISDYTKKQVLELWGPPDKKAGQGAEEKWVYHRGWGWSGLFAMAVIVPIPLLAPVGYRDTTLHFKGETVQSITEELTETKVRLCGLILGHGLYLGCV
ncbi:MAG: hypothetical protein M3O62_13945 [Pseudomonadota bacterium]|nr:hypothetical protein [Pseudomonadota bacterium]